MINLQEQVKKSFCYQKLFWPFTVWINCSSDLICFANSLPSASNFKSFFRSLEHFFLTVGHNIFANIIPFVIFPIFFFADFSRCNVGLWSGFDRSWRNGPSCSYQFVCKIQLWVSESGSFEKSLAGSKTWWRDVCCHIQIWKCAVKLFRIVTRWGLLKT